MGAQGYLRRLTRRLTEDPDQRDCESCPTRSQHRRAACHRLRAWPGGHDGGHPAQRGMNGKGCAGGVRAELFDGSDTVTLVWLGQRRIPGIDSGRTLRVRGRLGKLENGTKAIYNPHYEIQR